MGAVPNIPTTAPLADADAAVKLGRHETGLLLHEHDPALAATNHQRHRGAAAAGYATGRAAVGGRASCPAAASAAWCWSVWRADRARPQDAPAAARRATHECAARCGDDSCGLWGPLTPADSARTMCGADGGCRQQSSHRASSARMLAANSGALLARRSRISSGVSGGRLFSAAWSRRI